MSPRSVSGAGMMARGLDRVARPVLVDLVARLLALVPFLVLLLPVSSLGMLP